MENAYKSYIKLELTGDRLRSFFRSFVRSFVRPFVRSSVRSFDFVRSFRYGNVLLPQFARHGLVILHARTLHPCTT